MAGPGGGAEEVRERGEPDAADAALEQAAGERRGAERRLGQPVPVDEEQLSLEEALVEAGVVGDKQVVTRKVKEAAEDGRDRGRVPKLLLTQAGQPRDRVRERHPRVDERLV